MNIFKKLTKTNLKLNKKRTIVTIIGIILSTALITAVVTMYTSLLQSIINYEVFLKGNFHYGFNNVSKEEIERYESIKDVDKMFYTSNVGYSKIESENEYKPYAFIMAFNDESLNNLGIRLVEGKMPEKDDEIVISTHLKTNGRIEYNVGDTITLNVGKRIVDGKEVYQSTSYRSDEVLKDTVEKKYKIVGVIERPSNKLEPYEAPGYTFIIRDNNIKDNDSVNVYFRLTKTGLKRQEEVVADFLGVSKELLNKVQDPNYKASFEDLEEFTKILKDSIHEPIMNEYLIGLESDILGNTSTGNLGIVVLIVCIIIIFTSVYCIKNSFDISITEKTKQYGMLKSVGATKKQIRKNVLYEAFYLGIIGIPLGILCGIFASFILVKVCNYYLGDLLDMGLKLALSISLIGIVFATILGIVTIYLSALRSARKASKISPINSIRNNDDIKISSKKIKGSKIVDKIFGIGGQISYKNLKRNKRKYRTTVVSIIVSSSIFIALTSFVSLAFNVVKTELKMMDYNIKTIIYDVDNKETVKKGKDTVKFANIDNYTIVRDSNVEIDGKYLTDEYKNNNYYQLSEDNDVYEEIMTLDNESFKKYLKEINVSYEDAKDKIIIMNNTVIEKQVGNTVKEVYINAFKDNNSIEIKRNDEKYTLNTIYTDIKPFGFSNNSAELLIVSEDKFNTMFDKENRLTIYYKSSNPNGLQDEIDKYLKGEDYYIDNVYESVKQLENLFTLIAIFLYGFIIVITLIGVTNIFNTITTNMNLRQREFATLKSVGMTKKEFKRMISLESLFMGLKALMFAIPLGIILSYLIYYYLTTDMNMKYQLPYMSILVSIIAVFLLINVLMKYSINKINKQNIIETIRNENI